MISFSQFVLIIINKKAFTIAHTIFGAGGIILDIKNDKSAITFMDCNYWSCFVHEDERLLIGGLARLEFETIRNLAQSENYSKYIKVLNILESMAAGLGLDGMKPRPTDVICLQEMINFEVGAEVKNIMIPKYVQTLFHHFLMKRTEIIINLYLWDYHFWQYFEDFDENIYGYKKLSKIFKYNQKKSMVDLMLFIKLFPNAEMFTIAKSEITTVYPSINLTNDFVVKLLEIIEYVNKSSSSLSRIEIVKPASSIIQFIQNQKQKFEQNGWILKYDMFVGQGFYAFIGSQEMLLIEKMKN